MLWCRRYTFRYLAYHRKFTNGFTDRHIVVNALTDSLTVSSPSLPPLPPSSLISSPSWVLSSSPSYLRAMTGETSNGSWCMGIKGEMSGTVCVTFTWDMYIYIWVVYTLCFFCCLFITVTWWYVWCFEWASGNQEEVQACLVTLWLFIISCYSLYKTTLGLLCSWFENNPHFHKYSMDFHV